MDDLELQRARMRVASITAGLARDLSDAASMGLEVSVISTEPPAVHLTRIFGGGTRREVQVDVPALLALARLAVVNLSAEEDDDRLKDAIPEPHTRARVGDKGTARAAGIKAADPKNLNAIQQKVLQALRDAGEAGMTDLDLKNRFGNHGSTYRTRRAELAEAGLVQDSGRVEIQMGRERVVWVATRPAGRVQ